MSHVYDTKQSDCEARGQELWEMLGNSPLSLFTCPQGPIYGWNRTVRHLNCDKTNDFFLFKFWEMELFDQITVCKQMTEV